MKTKLLLTIALFGFLTTCFSQQNLSWDKWNWLIGDWVGEGNGIHYTITYSDKSIQLTSEKSADAPVFRLTYFSLDDSTINTKFEMSQDGEKFMTYIEGNSKKKK